MVADRHAELRKRLIEAAEAAIAANGLGALKARDLAKAAGCALGAIYNVFADMDELIFAVNARTLARLDAALAEAAAEPAGKLTPPSAIAQLQRLALIYLRFAAANRHAWTALFEHRMTSEKPAPDWTLTRPVELFTHIEGPLEIVLPEPDARTRNLVARTLFSAIHGIVLLGLEQRPVAAPPDELEAQISLFVASLLRGMMRPDAFD
ncbi:TetR/AcrR family transcriptional regulator [Methylocapsa acidiphila]|uniref:TetR/AcrR family transcriptional regulator n=1 Tax=Methylocapsa acidiphila TaxID=133552 RepID=UPI000407A54F|nr:TetR/AcrR family transcriptional regulator [Methylocapsa acidiphila]